MHDCGDMIIEIMPSFDHASSLGRELTDDKRRRILESDGVLRYVQRGRGGIYVDDRRKHALSPLRLARLLCRWRPAFTRRTVDRIDSVSEPTRPAVVVANKSLGMRDYPGHSGTEARQTPCLLGFLVAPTADGGSRLLVGVFPHSAIFEGG